VWKGHCLCGVGSIEIDVFAPGIAHCHCSMCRKFHGAEYATFATVPGGAFRWITGESSIREYRAPNDTVQRFCGTCGSSLTFAPSGPPADEVEVALALVKGKLPAKPDAHIFVASGASWTDIHDDLPQFVAGRDSADLRET
jgi:hypothetical protein